jgi:hypothetical protein
MDDYFADGTKLAWIVLPEEKTVLVLRPGLPTQTVLMGERLDAGGLLPGFTVPVDSLFP